tara:strand:- start:943 stop:1590 length:648 start_codon:yes stop_codon:yes gene_type:complete
MKKIAVLISGSGTNLQAIIDRCRSGYINGKIVSVISNNPNAFGLERAASSNIETKIINHSDYQSRDDFEDALYEHLAEIDADLIVLAGFMRILSHKITDYFMGKIINIHPSLLPKYPGLETHKKVIANKDNSHGVSVHFVSPELDSGPLIAQGEIKIHHNDNIDDIINRIHRIEHLIYPEVIKLICNNQIILNDNGIEFKENENTKGFIYRYYDF